MVASARVQQLNDGFDLLNVLAEYLKNPKLISQLEDEVSKLNTLTEDEAAKYNEAQILIQQRDSLNKEIASQRQTLADEKEAADAAADKAKQDSDDYVTTNKALVDKANQELDAREAELADLKTRLDQRENQLLEKAATVQSLFKSANAA